MTWRRQVYHTWENSSMVIPDNIHTEDICPIRKEEPIFSARTWNVLYHNKYISVYSVCSCALQMWPTPTLSPSY